MRSVGLSKISATVRGPASGRAVVRRRLERGGEGEHLGLLGGGQVVVAQEVPRQAPPGRRPALARIAGQAASERRRRRRSVSTSGGASRIVRRAGGVEDEAARRGRRRRRPARPRRRGRGRSAGPRPRTSVTAGLVGQRRRARRSPSVRRRGRAGRRPRWCRARRARRRRRPGCRRRWCRGCRARAASPASPRAMVAPIGMPPPRPLARVTTSGVTPSANGSWWANQAPGAADAGLHLVEPEQRAVLRGDLARRGEVAVRRHVHAGLALDGLEDDGRRLVGDGRGEGGRRRRTATKVTWPGSGSNGSR